MTLFDITRLVLTGMAISAPVGPISLLCMRTTLRSGLIAGLCAGLGAATADGTICCAALNGLGHILTASKFSITAVNFFAAAFLFYIALDILFTAHREHHETANPQESAGKTFLSTFLFTALNPITLITFAALFCGNTALKSAVEASIATSFCIFIGSCCWWLILSIFLTVARGHLDSRVTKLINVTSALFILAFSFKLITSL